MKRKRYSEEKIISLLKEHEAKRLRELEQENVKLKRLLGEAGLDKTALKELVEGKW